MHSTCNDKKLMIVIFDARNENYERDRLSRYISLLTVLLLSSD